MNDLKGLTYHMTYNDFMSYQMNFENHCGFYFKVLFDTFDKEERLNNHNLNRYIVCNAELLLLEDPVIVEYADEKERLELKERLTNEAQILRTTIESLDANKEDKENLRKGAVNNKFEKFDAKLSLLKDI